MWARRLRPSLLLKRLQSSVAAPEQATQILAVILADHQAERAAALADHQAERAALRAELKNEISSLQEKVDKLHQEKEEKLEKLVREMVKIETEAQVRTRVQLARISDLEIKIQMAKNNLNLRSALEIIVEVLRFQNQQIRIGPGVQPVLDAVGQGLFDEPGVATLGGASTGVSYQDAQAAVLAAVAAGGGVVAKDVSRALGRLYGELSKHHHSGMSTTIEMNEGEQTMAAAVATMSVILFARRLFHCQLDIIYRDGSGMTTILSQL